jgi:hypothetical protein
MIQKMSKYMAIGIGALAVYVFPMVAAAQQGGGIRNLVREAGGLIQGLIPIVIGLAVLIFLWGVLQYVITDEESGKENGRTFMLWGIVALFVMVSVWGLVNILKDTLQLNNATPPAPGLPRTIGQ